MRVIAGRYRRRPLFSVPGTAVRPTPDRLRESLFNILQPRLEGVTFLDAYAGSGAVGIEALSRGASRVILIEKNGPALDIIHKNLDLLKIGSEALVVRGNAPVVLKNYSPDIAFLDPPYELTQAYPDAISALTQTACPLVIAQHDSHLVLAERYERLQRVRVVRQGNNSLSFFEPVDSSP